MAKEVVGFDVTISVRCSTDRHQEVAANLKQIFREWVFQREVSASGYDHWQVRGKLWKPKSLKGAIAAFHDYVWNGDWGVTCNKTHQGKCFNYVMKADTRKDGPWSSTDPDFEDPPPLTRQLRVFYKKVEETGMYPWQRDLQQLIKREDDRAITCIVETSGNNGKSIFCEHLGYQRLAFELPPILIMEDLMAVCMCVAAQKVYLVDMPRSMKKDKLAGFYAGLECLKNGRMYDKRHFFKQRRIDRPQIVVFTNDPPDKELLIADRWDIYYIMHRELVPEAVVQGAKPVDLISGL